MSKKRKPRNKMQEPIVIDEKQLAQVMPVMLKSTDELFKYDNAFSDTDPIVPAFALRRAFGIRKSDIPAARWRIHSRIAQYQKQK